MNFPNDIPLNSSLEGRCADSASMGSGVYYILKALLKNIYTALAGVAQWIECRLQTKVSPVQFPVRAHAWVAGQVPSEGQVRGNHTLMFLSLSFSLASSLFI